MLNTLPSFKGAGSLAGGVPVEPLVFGVGLLPLLEAGVPPQPASSARDIAEARIRDSTFLVLLAFIFSPP